MRQGDACLLLGPFPEPAGMLSPAKRREGGFALFEGSTKHFGEAVVTDSIRGGEIKEALHINPGKPGERVLDPDSHRKRQYILLPGVEVGWLLFLGLT